ncbi:hypothetical protein WCLP8_4960001 [uncultured Gammaproteobacteria bacterium]
MGEGGRAAGADGGTEQPLQPQPDIAQVDRHHDVTLGGDDTARGFGRIAAEAEHIVGFQRLLGAEVATDEGQPGVITAGGGAPYALG